ncbi:MAG: hypothetical protein JWQ71_3673 [Pedosphaera sp.]|nr:hypothetical protein [Pedosphaera sp.]
MRSAAKSAPSHPETLAGAGRVSTWELTGIYCYRRYTEDNSAFLFHSFTMHCPCLAFLHEKVCKQPSPHKSLLRLFPL